MFKPFDKRAKARILLVASHSIERSQIRSPEVHAGYLERVHEDAKAYFRDVSTLEEVPCPACQASEYRQEFVKFGFTYVSCISCRTLYVRPRPKREPLKDFYVRSPSSRFWIDEFFKPYVEPRRQRIFRPRAALIAELLPRLAPEAVGDIGAGFGLFLEELRSLWPAAKLVAIEPSPEMATICRGKNLEVEESTIEDLAGLDGRFGLLTAFELLEHLHSPKRLIEKAFGLLRPGGYLFATTLNGEGFDIQLLWEKSRSVFPPHHLNFLNPDSLALLCRNVGFVVERMETPGALDWEMVEGAVNRKEVELDRFWEYLVRRGTPQSKADLQEWIAKHAFSSHMRVIAKKPES